MTRFRWLALALAISLILNLILVGFLAGRFSAGTFHRSLFDPAMGMRASARFLSEERQTELKPLFQEFRAAAPSLRRLRGTHRALAEAITAEPFERDTLERVLADFRNNLLTSQEAGHTAFINLVDGLTPDERRQFIDQIRKRLRSGKHHRHRHSTDKDRPSTASGPPI